MQTQYVEHQLPGGAACFHSILVPECDADGRVKTVLAINRNVTELKFTERQLKETNAVLIQKNIELEEFSYIAAHDLKAPMTNLQSLFKLMDKDAFTNAEGRDIFNKIQTTLLSMSAKLTALNDVLAIKTAFGEDRVGLKFENILQQVKVEISELLKESKATIRSDFSQCSDIDYSHLKLHSVIHNLVTNAIKYRHPQRETLIRLNTYYENSCPILEVHDNGLGIDPAMDKEKVFGLFKRMHTHVKGLGVGLYLVRSIVNGYGGHVELESKLNEGTTFKLYLT